MQPIAREESYSSNYGNYQFAEEEEKGKEVDILNKRKCH